MRKPLLAVGSFMGWLALTMQPQTATTTTAQTPQQAAGAGNMQAFSQTVITTLKELQTHLQASSLRDCVLVNVDLSVVDLSQVDVTGCSFWGCSGIDAGKRSIVGACFWCVYTHPLTHPASTHSHSHALARTYTTHTRARTHKYTLF